MEPINEIQTKRCSKCGRELPLTEFHRNASLADGLQKQCKECKRATNNKSNARRRQVELSFAAIKGDAGSPLAGFTPRELMDELRARGFHGTLTYTHEINL